MIAQQPKGRRLANDNEICTLMWPENSIAHKIHQDTAAELRRLHAVERQRDELLEALEFVMCTSELGCVTEAVVRSAIAKATGEAK